MQNKLKAGLEAIHRYQQLLHVANLVPSNSPSDKKNVASDIVNQVELCPQLWPAFGEALRSLGFGALVHGSSDSIGGSVIVNSSDRSRSIDNNSGIVERSMHVDVGRLLPVLASSLYANEWQVTIREMLQNAHDAAVLASPLDGHAPRSVTVSVDVGGRSITFEDEGIGMSLAEVEENLATIGFSSKDQLSEMIARRNKATNSRAPTLVGQYGIGFLAAFILAKKVDIETRKDGEPAVRAVFDGSNKWKSEQCSRAPLGTKVTLTIDSAKAEQCAFNLTSDVVEAALRRYGDLLSTPIYIRRGTSRTLCNTMVAPWSTPDTVDRKNVKAFIKRRQIEESADVLFPTPFELSRSNGDSIDARGVLYFSGETLQDSNAMSIGLFCHGMFIGDIPLAKLRHWMSLFGGYVECDDVTPRLDRNDIVYTHKEAQCLLDGLQDKALSTIQSVLQSNDKFRVLWEKHHSRIKSEMAADWNTRAGGPAEFFRRLITHVPFDMPAGLHKVESVTLPKYAEKMKKFAQAPWVPESIKNQARDLIVYVSPVSVHLQRQLMTDEVPCLLAMDTHEKETLVAYGVLNNGTVVCIDAASLYAQQSDASGSDDDWKKWQQVKQLLIDSMNPPPESIIVTSLSTIDVPMMFVRAKQTADANRAQAIDVLLGQVQQLIGADMAGRHLADLQKANEGIRDGKERFVLLLNRSNEVLRRMVDGVVGVEGGPDPGYAVRCQDLLLHIFYSSAEWAGMVFNTDSVVYHRRAAFYMSYLDGTATTPARSELTRSGNKISDENNDVD